MSALIAIAEFLIIIGLLTRMSRNYRAYDELRQELFARDADHEAIAVPSTQCACLKPGGDPLGTCEQCSPSAQRCAKCGCETKSEEALVNGEIWCHPCADTVALPSPSRATPTEDQVKYARELADDRRYWEQK